jgi:8-oxo-dGTP pyrophosphatase MutT (NUDIX family)
MNLFKTPKIKKEKGVTCAVMFLTPSNNVLIVHPNGAPWNCWSFPKGLAEADETPANAAARELQEETGLVINANELIDLGRFPYVSEKDYHLFLYRSKFEPQFEKLVCESTFINKKGDETREVDNFKLIPLAEVHTLLNKKQAEIFLTHQNSIVYLKGMLIS